MPTFYLDPINGNDSYNGTTWELARKTMTATGWQAYPTLTGDSIINVAKSPDPVNVGSATFTNASKVVTLNDPVVTTLFDSYGDYNKELTMLYKNSPITGTTSFIYSSGNNSPIRLHGQIVQSGRTDQNGQAIPTTTLSYIGTLMVGATTNTSLPLTGMPKQYLAVKMSGRQGQTVAIGLNSSAPANTGIATGTTIGRTTENVQLVTDMVYPRSVIRGSVLYGNNVNEQIGANDVLFFEVGTLLDAEARLKSISFFTNGGNVTMTIDSVYWVTGLVLPGQEWGSIVLPTNPLASNGRITNGGLNMVIGGPLNRTMMQMGSFSIQQSVENSTRGPAKIAANMTFNWGFETQTTTGRMAHTYHINYDAFLSAGASGFLNFQVRGGVNRETTVIDGVTRLSNVFQTATGTSPGVNNFELYLRNGSMSGFSTHNFAQGLRLKLNSTRQNENYTFEDIQGNNYGYYLYSDDGTCPSKVYVHYKNFGPNNALLTDATLAACSGWSANLTKAYANTSTANVGFSLTVVGAPPIVLEWNAINVTSASSFSPKFIKPFRWSSTNTSAFSQTSLRRNRGMRFVSTATSSMAESLRRATKRPWSVVTNTSSVSVRYGKVISPKFTSVTYTGVSTSYEVGKGFAWNAPATSAAVFSLPTNIPVNWSTGTTSTEDFTVTRTRGYKWSSPMTVTYTQVAGVGRTARYTSVNTTNVEEKLSKTVVRGFSSNSTTAVVNNAPVVRGLSVLIQTVSSGAVNLLRAMKIGNFTSSNTTNVSETLMRARTVSMPVVATSTIATTTRRGKAVEFALSAASSVTNRIRRSIPGQWVSSNNVQVYFDQNKMFRWTVGIASTVVNSIRRNRGVNFTAQEAMNTSWNVGANRGTSMANVSANSSAQMSLDRVRGMFFTIPVTGSMLWDIDLKSRTNSVITAHPVISISLTRSNNRGFEVLGQTGSYMSVRLNKGMFYTVGQYVTIDGELLKDTFVEQDGFGAISSSDFAFGIGRGVRHETLSELDVSMDMVRDIIIGWGVTSNSNMGISSSPNRLDAFYVEYEEPVTSSLKDGSIVMGQRKTYSSGVLHDVRPVYDVTIYPAPTYTITLYEEVYA